MKLGHSNVFKSVENIWSKEKKNLAHLRSLVKKESKNQNIGYIYRTKKYLNMKDLNNFCRHQGLRRDVDKGH